MHKAYKFFIIFFIYFNFINFSSAYTKLFEPEIPGEINVIISWKYLKEYTDILNKSSKNPRAPIPQESKKKFRAKIYYLDQKGEMNILPSNVRITGDWQDHIDNKKKISSLKINLREGNVGNIVNFRLLLSSSRDFDSEIFWSSLFETLGYPSLYKKIVNVSINGLPQEKMLFEESTSKEFLERFSLRELPIIETDERLFWYKKVKAFNECSDLMHLASVSYQDKCIKQYNKNNFENEEISWNWKVDNKGFLKNKTAYKIGIKALQNIDANEKIENNFNSFKKLNNQLAYHAIRMNNLKKIYDPIYNFYTPIYFDGDVNREEFKRFCEKNSVDGNIDKKLEQNIVKLSDIYFKRTGKKINSNFKCVASILLSDEKNYFSLKSILKNIESYNKNKFIKKNNSFPYVLTDLSFTESKICLSEKECQISNEDIIKDVIAGDYIFVDKNNNKFFPYLNVENKVQNNVKFIKVKSDEDKFFDIYDNQTLYLDLNNFNKNIQLNYKSEFSKAVIFNSNLINSKIKINSSDKFQFKNNESTYDENLLTGCLTIIDSYLENISIESNYSNCEDSINIIRSSGTINELNIKNSLFDLVDFDFSNIKIEKAILVNAKNDCIDFSYGNYLIKNISAHKCGDKGVSVGEKSSIEIKNLIGSQNYLDFAVKDSSILYLSKFDTDKDLDYKCGSIYKKKQEFNGGKIFYSNSSFPCKITKDLYSEINLNAKK